jgi:hypothetical protein
MLADATGYHASFDVLLHAASMNSSTNEVQFLTATDIQVIRDQTIQWSIII